MGITLGECRVGSILTRTTGYLKTVSSHSLQPYRGCSLGKTLCGVGCYVQHNPFLTRGEIWGSFLEARTNAAEAYRDQYERERAWARRGGEAFSVFMSSSTEPFLPQERRFRITRAVLEAMREAPPDRLILQTHSHRVADEIDLIRQVARRCELRVHLSIETDIERLPGLPGPASSVASRIDAAARLRGADLFTVVTVAPLLPMRDPQGFFERIGRVAHAVVIDHYVGGDGSRDGARTGRTRLPDAMASIDPTSTDVAYRDRMVDIARRIFPGRVGVGIDGFAGRYLSSV